MKPGVMETVTQKLMCLDVLAKNGIPLAWLNASKGAKGGCFGSVFMVCGKNVLYSGRKNGVDWGGELSGEGSTHS